MHFSTGKKINEPSTCVSITILLFSPEKCIEDEAANAPDSLYHAEPW
jgi:hypothetical protein